jgi:hypothetical protein
MVILPYIRLRRLFMSKIKTFDCVESKHRAAEKIYAKLAKSSRKAQLNFWKKATEELKHTSK